ncbi:50S ribosomal protein L3 [Buchnera aphidicola]|uniref:Large ribosomal subunit protein uL3 n=2 Tax=Buchnera aphidicola (Cinara cedri) TaxID=261318 RepID=RL3_BUCCC|nr:50S ribosomal protein L3 [Buchnera aphidicola]Q057A4.1 RecName: Full=Large ribosomal subunit protein uL3; AltName: Full=50S ribosomal protein L3 [Buchnera aphidicola BCc]AAW72707.1 50S ribosomal protein L3 [Buchnera aphidicola (Cinara cedri)]ABJ90795.1 50S ribosomal protein L3 [Buchnera aphidicola BCc]
MIGLVGKKLGMTRIFFEEYTSIPVTAIEILDNIVVQVKTIENDNYESIQLTTGFKKEKKVLKSEYGHFLKFNVSVGRGLWEFKCKNSSNYSSGQKITINFFKNIKKLDITGISKGKGFAGTVKRWNFRMQDATHGNSLSHRVPGSIGQNQTPGHVFKGKKMSGHLGDQRTTIQNLKIVKIDDINKIILIKGSIPGSIGSDILLKPSIK